VEKAPAFKILLDHEAMKRVGALITKDEMMREPEKFPQVKGVYGSARTLTLVCSFPGDFCEKKIKDSKYMNTKVPELLLIVILLPINYTVALQLRQ
jgi:hypothetical protein